MSESEIKLQYQLSNGTWMPADARPQYSDRTDEFLARCERNNGVNDAGEIIPRHHAARDLTRDEVIAALQAGQTLRNAPDDWYSNCRSGAFVEQAMAARRAQQKPVEMVRCDCGHSVPRHLVMSASLGTACAECYDRMS